MFLLQRIKKPGESSTPPGSPGESTILKAITPLGLAACLSLMGDLSLYAVLVTQLDVVHLNLADLGILLSIHRFLRIPANPFVGLLMDRFGRRRLFLLGMVFAAASTAMYGIVSGFWLFFLSRLMWGIAWSLINMGGLNVVLDLSTETTRGRLAGIFSAWVLAGYAVGPFVGGLLVDGLGFRLAMLICAGVTTLGLLAAFLWMPETLAPSTARSSMALSNTTLPGVSTRVHHLPAPRWLVRMLHQKLSGIWQNKRSFLALLLQGMSRFIEDGVILSTLTLLLIERFGKSMELGFWIVGAATAGGVMIAGRSILAAISAPLAGRLSDRLGRLPLIVISLLVGITSLVFLGFVNSPAGLLMGVGFGALSGSILASVLTAYMGDNTPPGKRGGWMGAFATAGDLGSMLGPLTVFTVVPVFGLKTIFLISVVIEGVGLLLVLVQHFYNKSQR